MSTNSVEVAFELMLAELDRSTEDINSQGAALFQNSEYDTARTLVETALKLKAFRGKVDDLRREWLRDHSANFPETEDATIEEVRRTIAFAPKSSKTLLVVSFPDGETIFEPKASDTLAKCVKKLGFERVSALGRKVNGEDLVSQKPSTKNYTSTFIDGYYIRTHSNTETKKETIERISSALGVVLRIKVVAG